MCTLRSLFESHSISSSYVVHGVASFSPQLRMIAAVCMTTLLVVGPIVHATVFIRIAEFVSTSSIPPDVANQNYYFEVYDYSKAKQETINSGTVAK